MADKKLTLLQDEIKLLKGEVKQSLASVRDYLLNMELPSSEISTILAALGGDSEQKITMKGSFAMPPGGGADIEPEVTDSIAEESPDAEDSGQEESEMYDVEDPLAEDSPPSGEDDPPSGDSGELPSDEHLTSDGIPEDLAGYDIDEMPPTDDQEDETPEPEPVNDEGEPMEYDSITAEADPSIPKVNMMANLINWVSRAKHEIGYDQMSTFLEVYGISGHLSPELKDVILHLAEITEEKTEVTTSAGVWSEFMLSLHGILTGGQAPLHPMIPSWSSEPDIEDQIDEHEIIDVDQPEEMPVKLKLVFPNGNGKTREFCVDLTPDPDESGEEKQNRN